MQILTVQLYGRPPLSDRVADVGPISPTCVLPLMDNSALLYYVFHIDRSRIKFAASCTAVHVILSKASPEHRTLRSTGLQSGDYNPVTTLPTATHEKVLVIFDR